MKWKRLFAKKKKSSNGRNSDGRSRNRSKTSSKTKKLKRVLKKQVNIHALEDDVKQLQEKTRKIFKKKKKTPKSLTPPSIVVQVKDLDNGKRNEMILVKDLNTGRHVLY